MNVTNVDNCNEILGLGSDFAIFWFGIKSSEIVKIRIEIRLEIIILFLIIFNCWYYCFCPSISFDLYHVLVSNSFNSYVFVCEILIVNGEVIVATWKGKFHKS